MTLAGVTRREPDQEEIHHDDREQDDHALQDTLGDKRQHQMPTIAASR
jgi:hypothetical protein